MSSSTAMKKYTGKVNINMLDSMICVGSGHPEYFARKLYNIFKVANYRASEGKTIRVPYRGPVSYTVLDMLGGIRSACTYTGQTHLDALFAMKRSRE